MRLYLHIGVEKTGTSSIQQFLRINRDALKGAGVLFPRTPGLENHMALAAAAQNDQKRDDLRILYNLDSTPKIRDFRKHLTDQLIAEAHQSACEAMVLSGEHCSSRLTTRAEVDLLLRMLSVLTNDIRIVVYLRRQDQFLCSTYSTDVKSGFTGPMSFPSAELREQRYNYDLLLKRWSAATDKSNIICRIYDRETLQQGDVVADFAEIIGIEAAAYRRPERVNESLDVEALEFLRLFNQTVPRFKDNSPNLARSNVVKLLQEVSSGPAPGLPEEQLAEFMRHFRESNTRVALEYFGTLQSEGDPLFGPLQKTGNRAEARPITAETAVRLAALLWERKQQQVAKLTDRVAKLEGGGRSDQPAE
jgi:hypothetical protein